MKAGREHRVPLSGQALVLLDRARELALAHVTGDRVEAAYRRSDLFERRRD